MEKSFIRNGSIKRRDKHLGTIMNDIHALSIHSFNYDEFKLNPAILGSPECAHKK